jgi:ATP phosphoribosyltransferase regulatory subunit
MAAVLAAAPAPRYNRPRLPTRPSDPPFRIDSPLLMASLPHAALLPAGFHDVLPPYAAHEAAIIERTLQTCDSFGYQRVKPPLVEFEESLLGGSGAALSNETFRLLDPISQRMMAVRADMTLQVARIAVSRLADRPRPLRLAYAGQVLRVRGSQLRPERQFGQVGAELIGAARPTADAEVIRLTVAALSAVGLSDLSLDLNMPGLTRGLLSAFAVEGERAVALRQALDRKNAALVAELGGEAAPLLRGLIDASGPLSRARERVGKLDLPGKPAGKLQRLLTVAGMIEEALPGLPITLDFVEHRGFEYQRGVCFTLFDRAAGKELGRGGHYLVGGSDAVTGEPATGFSLFMDSVLTSLAPAARPERIYLPFGTPLADGDRLRAEGRAAVAALEPDKDPVEAARRMGCTALFADGRVVPLDPPPA